MTLTKYKFSEITKRKVITSLILILFTSHGWSQSRGMHHLHNQSVFHSDTTALDRFIIQTMETHQIPGISACAVKAGRVIWNGNFGYANIEENIPVTDSTLFMLASISKTFIGVALMQLWEKELFELDDDINNYLPFEVMNPRHPKNSITPRMLMAHTSSISDNWPQLMPLETWGHDQTISIREFLENYLTARGDYYSLSNFSLAKPGTAFEYTNVGATLAAYLVEAITAMTFEAYCREHIFSPLNMNETSFLLAGINPDHIALPYYLKGDVYEPYGHYSMAVYPAATLRTSALQLARHLISVMEKGQYQGVRLLESETVEMITTIQYPQITEFFGLLWYYISFNNRTIWGHYGSYYGVRTAMFYCPDQNTGAIVLLNRRNRTPLNLIMHEIFEFAEDYSIVDANHNEFNEIAALYQNFPNPFNPSTQIVYRLNESGFVSLKVFDVLGREIQTLINEQQEPNTYLIEFDAVQLPNGIYFYELKVGNRFLKTKKMLFMQ